MAFDLTIILGCSLRDPQVRALFEYFEETPEATERDEELGGRHYLQFFSSGFSLLLSGADIIETVHIYTRPNPPYRACTNALPFDLSAHTTQAEARDLFGPPTTAGGPVRAILPPKPIRYWDRWEYAHHYFHLTYSEHRDATELITLEFVPTHTT
jgi:hypothetical protein